ncbi:L domain-like protein [Trametes coccinea BRFM310]|uniref:L domain-like protein n=1 Tax=Trametes coccinea (strain BRFM310) TaxID=1353009 RepID=A0A1Y2I965_TRAC3|nr:L domain-like protein [Trametes coccinea BRFM310]
MSRLPQPTSRSGSRSPLKSPSSPSPTPRAAPTASTLTPAKPRIRTQSVAPTPSPRQATPLRSQPSLKSLRPTPARSPTKSPARRTQPLPPEEDVPPVPSKPQLSIREQIALRRAEAKKLAAKSSSPAASGDFVGLEDASPETFNQPPAVDVDLGRWSIKETIERARSSGAINLASRDLPCLPSALFEIHLGIKPEPLKSVPVEPPITTATSSDVRKKASQNAPSWYEAQDLEVLKAWSNEIVELQPEISMFGSLKTVDLHNNKLTTLPDSFADLTALTTVDLSHNQLTSLPANFWALPNLTTLNLSHNALTALPFSAPFVAQGSNPLGRTRDPRGEWFSETITRATEPLPRLTVLEVSHNRISAAAIDHALEGPGLPALIIKLDLSENPLGKSDSLFRALGRLQRLKEIHMQRADIGDDSFPVSIFSSDDSLFPALKILDLEETYVSRPAMEAVFTPNILKQTVQFDVTTQEPPEGVLRIIVGKRVVREPWEIEAERRSKLRRNAAAAGPFATSSVSSSAAATGDVAKEPWEVEAEQGLLSDGAKRRARALATASQSSPSASASGANGSASTPGSPQKKPVEKEPWELEAEAGLLSAGARRRARAAAVAAALSGSSDPSAPATVSKTPSPTGSPSPSITPAAVASALANPQVYSASTQTLTLPPSTPPSKAAHMRSFSLASPALKKGLGGPATTELALAIPTPTLPLAAIVTQPFAQTLKVLILTGRRNDPSFSVPSVDGVYLPCLEELSLENCNLGDSVPVSHVSDNGDDFNRTSEPLLPLIARLFPSLRTLDLSYNALTSTALTKDALSVLILADSSATHEGDSSVKKGLRHLRLRGNRLNDLDGFQQLSERFRGNRDLPEWKLEELDLRDNEIGKLPPELGMLPLDVFLVDGNTFRVPPRRVWEREGTKGLLSWLRGRME